MPSSTRASGRFLAVGQSGQTGKRTVSAHPYFKVRRRQGRKQLEKGPLKETKKGTRLALSKRSQLALFCCSVPDSASFRRYRIVWRNCLDSMFESSSIFIWRNVTPRSPTKSPTF